MSTETPVNPVTDLKNNALTLAAAPVLAALQSLQDNPTTLNIAAQGVALQGALIGAAPALQALGIKDIAALLHEKITAAITAIKTPAAPAAPAAPVSPEVTATTIAS